jgi:hypothetical protein
VDPTQLWSLTNELYFAPIRHDVVDHAGTSPWLPAAPQHVLETPRRENYLNVVDTRLNIVS